MTLSRRVIFPKRQPRGRHYQVSYMPCTKAWQFVARHDYEDTSAVYVRVPADGTRRAALRLMELQIEKDKEDGLFQ